MSGMLVCAAAATVACSPPPPPPHSAMAKFKGLDKRAQEGSQDTAVQSTHQNAITQASPFAGSPGRVGKFVTSGVDGRIVIWDCKSLEASIAGLKIQ